MPTKDQKPIIFLAFANDHSDQTRYLRSLRDETRALQTILEQVMRQGLVELIVRPYATIDDILDVFQSYRDQIAIFHFAGHANGYQLLLESSGREIAVANAGGLAAFLGQQTGLQLVFLNGCSTRQQVQGLLAANVPAVIATSWAIDDQTAMDFAARFYKGLAGKATIRTAYNEAEAAIKVIQGNDPRGALRRVQEVPQDRWPWGLYSQAESKVADQWSLATYGEFQPDQPRLPYEPETVLIPAGPFLMGNEPGEGVSKWETPQFEIELPAYGVGKYPVTNEQYAEFTRQTGRLVSPETGWEGQKPGDDKLNHPMMGVTWYDALAYCQWLTEQTNGQRQYTLPSEAQWEKAARGTDGSIYPWGNEWEVNRCNHDGDETTPVDAYEPQSKYGCYDMVGNVREWTTTLWGQRMVAPDPEFRYPWVDDNRRDNLTAKNHIYRVYRGGAFSDDIARLRCNARHGFDPRKTGERSKRHGFRVTLKL